MSRYVVFAAIIVSLACDRNPGQTCTLIGCTNELTVEIQNAPPGPITIQAAPVGSADSVHTATCPGESGCTTTVSFRGFAPARVRLTVTTAAGTRLWDVTPSYATFQPNGRGCPDICRTGTIRLTWR